VGSEMTCQAAVVFEVFENFASHFIFVCQGCAELFPDAFCACRMPRHARGTWIQRTPIRQGAPHRFLADSSQGSVNRYR